MLGSAGSREKWIHQRSDDRTNEECLWREYNENSTVLAQCHSTQRRALFLINFEPGVPYTYHAALPTSNSHRVPAGRHVWELEVLRNKRFSESALWRNQTPPKLKSLFIKGRNKNRFTRKIFNNKNHVLNGAWKDFQGERLRSSTVDAREATRVWRFSGRINAWQLAKHGLSLTKLVFLQ